MFNNVQKEIICIMFDFETSETNDKIINIEFRIGSVIHRD